MTNNIFLIIISFIPAIICRITMFMLNKKRRVPHPTHYHNDPAGTTSDSLMIIFFILFSTPAAYWVFQKILNNANEQCIKTLATHKNVSKEEIDNCKLKVEYKNNN